MNSNIILCKNIKIDNEYKNVLSYSEQEMIDLCKSPEHLLGMQQDYSFIRQENAISVNFSYADCLRANYIAYQNKDFSNKWFFAFIDRVEFKNPNTTYIYFTVDSFSTWYDKWSRNECFVIREHAIDDSVGANLLPENLELGDYTSVLQPAKILKNPEEFCICMAVTELPDGVPANNNSREYNGIFGGLQYLSFYDIIDCRIAILFYDYKGKADAINSLFLIPKNMKTVTEATVVDWDLKALGQTVQSITVFYLASTAGADFIDKLSVDTPNELENEYVPVNKKLLTYPYTYLLATNNSGINEVFRYEDFPLNPEINKRLIQFRLEGCITPGMEIKAIPGPSYKNVANYYNAGIMLGKLPVCSWNSDVYINWLTQNGVNNGLSTMTNALSFGANLGLLNIKGTFDSAISIYDSIHENRLADMVPNQARGNTNAGDINFSYLDDGGLTVYYMSIKEQNAKIIDDFFTRYGYKTNRLKLANLNTRKYFNYVQIASGENIGYGEVPANYMEDINNIFRNGVTIWHDHDRIGNYNENINV